MTVFINIATLFVVGSVLGYGIEVLYKRLISQKKWVNPGFMRGPYLPIYGFGTCVLYGLWNITLPLPDWGAALVKLLIICMTMTLLELVGGLFFLKVFHMRLWNYSKRWGNFKGVICPLFSLIWTVIGALYYFFLNDLFIQLLNTINTQLVYDFFIGIGVGMIIVDACYSFHVGIKVSQKLKGFQIHYDEFRESFRESKSGKKFTSFSLLVTSKADDLKKHAIYTKENIIAKREQIKKRRKTK